MSQVRQGLAGLTNLLNHRLHAVLVSDIMSVSETPRGREYRLGKCASLFAVAPWVSVTCLTDSVAVFVLAAEWFNLAMRASRSARTSSSSTRSAPVGSFKSLPSAQ